MVDYSPPGEQVLPFENLPSTDTPLTAEWLNHVNAFLADVGTASTGRLPALEAASGAEGIRDTIGAALVAGNNMTVTVDDGANTITLAATTNSETIRDTIGAALVAGVGVAITVDDAGNTITIGRAASRVVAMTDGATITPNADTTDIGTVTLGGNRAIAAPSGAPAAGQKLILRLRQDGTGSRTVTWNSIYRFAGGVAPTLTTTAAKTDYLGFVYNADDTKWDCVAHRLGF